MAFFFSDQSRGGQLQLFYNCTGQGNVECFAQAVYRQEVPAEMSKQ